MPKQIPMAVLFLAELFHLTASAQPFNPVDQFPQPAPGSFVVVGTNLPDGRLILWNGLHVFIQSGVGGGLFGVVATGYTGDPGFITMAPDGETALLGAGFNPRMYLLNTQNPVNYVPGSELTTPTHFSGAFLNDDLVLIDRANDAFDGSELAVIDITSAKSAPTMRSVVRKSPLDQPKVLVVDKPPFSFSSSVRVDPTGTLVYAMDANVRELRTFLVADLINAFMTATPLDWSVDGVLIGAPGDYFTGGVAGFTPAGNLVIGGSEGFLMPGGIQIVDPVSGAILNILDPAGTQEYYDVIYNSVTDEIIARTGSGVTFASLDAIAAVPAAGRIALIVLAAVVAIAFRQNRSH